MGSMLMVIAQEQVIRLDTSMLQKLKELFVRGHQKPTPFEALRNGYIDTIISCKRQLHVAGWLEKQRPTTNRESEADLRAAHGTTFGKLELSLRDSYSGLPIEDLQRLAESYQHSMKEFHAREEPHSPDDGLIFMDGTGDAEYAWLEQRNGHQDLVDSAAALMQDVMVTGTANGVSFDQLGRQDKLRLLEMAIDWNEYIDGGMSQDTPPLMMFNAVDGKPPELWLEQTPEEAKTRRGELDGYAKEFDAACERIRVAQEAREQERAEGAWEMRETEGIAHHEKLLQEAFNDVQQVMERGYHEEYDSEGFVESSHFSELGPAYKLQLLEQSIDWKGYIDRGMDPHTPPLIIRNAVDGKPREQWLEHRPEETNSTEGNEAKAKQAEEMTLEKLLQTSARSEGGQSTPEQTQEIRRGRGGR